MQSFVKISQQAGVKVEERDRHTDSVANLLYRWCGLIQPNFSDHFTVCTV